MNKPRIIYRIHVTVHVYVEDHLADEVLIKHSRSYGIHGKEIVIPLRRINNKTIRLKTSNSFTVEELWDKINAHLSRRGRIYSSTYYEKYLVFNNLRYSIENKDKPLHYYLQRMKVDDNGLVEVQLLLNMDAGEVLDDDGIRYYIHSKESGKHHKPHVHVDIRHEKSAVFSLLDGEQLDGDKIKKKDITKIQNRLEERREELLKYWNEHTDGLTVDLNQALNLIHY